MVEIFKTNVQDSEQAQSLIKTLNTVYVGYKINIDLDDCDKILRIEGDDVSILHILNVVNQQGHECLWIE